MLILEFPLSYINWQWTKPLVLNLEASVFFQDSCEPDYMNESVKINYFTSLGYCNRLLISQTV